MSQETTSDTSSPSYAMGYGEEFQKLLRIRSAERNAAHLLPHLEPGQRILDFGCGPGTISMGLAKAVEPGELHGIDTEESQIAIARAAAEAGGHGNASFRRGDATDLPFDDDSFDVAHCHAVLNHVPGTAAVLSEVMRVLKPGGLLSCREIFVDSSFFEPDVGEGWVIFENLLSAAGGHPQMGKQLRHALAEAGFADVSASASFEAFGTPGGIDFMHDFVSGWFFSPDIVEKVTKFGLASTEEIEESRGLLDQWRQHPGAFAAIAWGEALGRKPLPAA